MKPIVIFVPLLALLAAGCATRTPTQVVNSRGMQKTGRMIRTRTIERKNTGKMVDEPFVQLYIHEAITADTVKKSVLIPPLGIDSADLRETFTLQLFNYALHDFRNPLDRISVNSSFEPYIDEDNLIAPDGSLNIPELCAIGTLKKATHILCPIVDEIKPYDPQKITLRIALINIAEKKIVAELSGCFDAKEQSTYKAFSKYSKSYESGQDLRTKMQSPSNYRRFVAYMCAKVLSEKLPL